MIIRAATPYGQMVDFLRDNPYVTRDEYLWEWTMPQIRLASIDHTRTVYLSEKQAQKVRERKKTFDDPMAFMNDLGLPIFQANE